MIKIALLGSTGSIGVQTLEVAARHRDRFEIASLAAGKNVRAFFKQIDRFAPSVAALSVFPEEMKDRVFYDGEGAYTQAGGKNAAFISARTPFSAPSSGRRTWWWWRSSALSA